MNKKISLRKVTFSFGSIAVVAIPIATSISFGVGPRTSNSFESLVASLVSSSSIENISSSLKTKVLNSGSAYYQDILKSSSNNSKKYWNLKDTSDFRRAVEKLAISSGIFTDQEKLIAAKEILKNQGYTDFIENMGFNKNAVTSYFDVNKDKNLPLTSLVDAQTRIGTNNVKGSTGYLSDYHVQQANQYNDRLYDFSNSDILKYYESLAFTSNEFASLFLLARSYVNSIFIGPEQSLSDFIKNWNTSIDVFYNKITSNGKLDTSFVKSLPDFKYIQKIDGTANSDNAAYNLILNSKINSYSTTPSQITIKSNAYASTTTTSLDKKVARYSLVQDAINALLLPYRQKAAIELRKNVSENLPLEAIFKANSSKIDNFENLWQGEEFNAALSFATVLFSKSANLAQDVQIRILDNPFVDSGLLIRTGHNMAASFERVDNLNIKAAFLQYNTSADLRFYYSGVKSPTSVVSQSITTLQESGVYNLPQIEADQKGVLWSESSTSYAMGLEIQGNYFGPRLPVYENDHDPDEALKNSTTWVTTPSTRSQVVLTEYDHKPNSWLDFWRDENSVAPREDEYTRFSALSNHLSTLFESAWANWQEAHNSSVDSSVTYSNPRIIINKVSFPQVRFNTYNDAGYDNTHSDHFKFDQAFIDYTLEVTETIN